MTKLNESQIKELEEQIAHFINKPASLNEKLKRLESVKFDWELFKKTGLNNLIKKISKNTENKFTEENSKLATDIRQQWRNTPIEQHKEQKQFSISDDKSAQSQEVISEDQDVPQDPIRKKFFSQLQKLINEKGKSINEEKRSKIVSKMEKMIYEYSSDQKKPYTSIAWEKWLLLNDAKNTQIIQQILEEEISIYDFVYQNASELLKNSSQQKLIEQQKKYQMESLQADFYIKNNVVKEGEFQCFKCKSRKISTHQKQMRSADEPMTTFFHCADCNNRWKN